MSEEAFMVWAAAPPSTMQLPSFVSSASGTSGANITSTGSVVNDFAVSLQYRGVAPPPGGFTGFTSLGSEVSSGNSALAITSGYKLVSSASEVFTPLPNTGGSNLIGWWRGVSTTTPITVLFSNGSGTNVTFPSLSWTAGQQRLVILGFQSLNNDTITAPAGFTFGASQNGSGQRTRLGQSNTLLTTSFAGASLTMTTSATWFTFSLAVSGIFN